MHPVYVNGLPLPSQLVSRLEAGQWKRPEDFAALGKLTGASCPEDFTFLGIESMQFETAGVRKIAADPKFSQIYGLASSKELGCPITELDTLDIDLAVMIAVNWDEEAIFLDYRNSKQRPAVVLTWWPDGNPPAASYKVIAVSIEEFARFIGLPIASSSAKNANLGG